MAGRKKEFIKDRTRLLLFGFLGLFIMLVYIFFVGILGNSTLFFLLGIFIVWYFLKSPQRRKRFGRKLDGFKKSYLAKSKNIFGKIPAVVWGGFAVFGIFIFGMLLGLSFTEYEDQGFEKTSKDKEYLELFTAYEELTDLFLYQNQDAEIMSDYEMLLEHPEEVADAVRSYRQKRDEIIFQAGRIMELRKRAGLQAENRL